MSAELFDTPNAPNGASNNAPKHPDAAPPSNVVELRPDGVFIEHEERESGNVHWIRRRRGGRSSAAVAYDLGELMELHKVLGRYLETYR